MCCRLYQCSYHYLTASVCCCRCQALPRSGVIASFYGFSHLLQASGASSCCRLQHWTRLQHWRQKCVFIGQELIVQGQQHLGAVETGTQKPVCHSRSMLDRPCHLNTACWSLLFAASVTGQCAHSCRTFSPLLQLSECQVRYFTVI